MWCATRTIKRGIRTVSSHIMYSAHMQTNHALEDMNIDMLVLVDKYLHTYLPPLPSQTILPSSQTISRRRMDHFFSATHSSDQSGNSRKIRL
mmetsp:Transcript_9582/g.14622  ORF Transcript_9582/g.14622 Transcript_9582/m.14622 type:complete len:92 (+) Transcript_9582:1096-1371(+)